ncbi:MAG: NUDIX domain-containing protein [Alphaproteobacteria bacterium]|nr:NUDIX domain-containing protein [Alphaproteobacteria bacterium]
MAVAPPLFLFGTLRHPPILQIVLGHKRAKLVPARLPGWRAFCAAAHDFPILAAGDGEVAEGLLLMDPSDQDLARLDFYEGGFGYVLEPREVLTGGGPVKAQLYVPEQDRWSPGAPWDLDDWAVRHGALTARAAAMYMAGFGTSSAREMARRFPAIRARADAEMRAEATAPPVDLRRGSGGRSVVTRDARIPYAGFFDIAEQDIEFPRFDGGQSPTVTRMALVGGDAVTVLPYDPARDRVLLVEQFRFGPYLRGDPEPWSLEAVAGRIDPGETAQGAALREAREEAGLEIGELWPVATFYPSPGVFTEYIYAFVGRADLPDTDMRLGGADAEDEDILSHVIPFARLMEIVASGEADTGPLVLSAWWLSANRDRLRRLA